MMKLWLLKARYDLEPDEDLWMPWFDRAFGFVIMAPDEQTAREIAQRKGGAETKKYSTTIPAWTDSKYSTCVELKAADYKEPMVVIKDFASA